VERCRKSLRRNPQACHCCIRQRQPSLLSSTPLGSFPSMREGSASDSITYVTRFPTSILLTSTFRVSNYYLAVPNSKSVRAPATLNEIWASALWEKRRNG
jgi:hypothetical protein